MSSQVKVQLKWAFYIEGLINLATTILCFVAPAFFLAQMTAEEITPLSKNLVYWYGVLLFVITAMMVSILYIEEKKSFILIMISYLIGDFLQIAFAIYFALSLSSWSVGIISTIGITVPLIILRIIVLAKPDWLGFKEKTTNL